jgi:hypothetical protein
MEASTKHGPRSGRIAPSCMWTLLEWRTTLLRRHSLLVWDSTTKMARLSGLQKDVLTLYRQCLRAMREKPTVGAHVIDSSTDSSRRQDRISTNLRGKQNLAVRSEIHHCLRVPELNFGNTLMSARKTLVPSNTCFGEDGISSKLIETQESETYMGNEGSLLCCWKWKSAP